VAPEPVFAWQAHPAREHAGRAAAGLAVVAALAFGSVAVMGAAWWGLVAVAILLAALNRFYFPSRFVVDEEGITARHALGSRRLRWAEVRRFAHDDEGGLLTTRAGDSWLTAHRGVSVLFGSHREAVLARLRALLPEGAAAWDR
jgi:hypothetical protein